MSLLSEAQACQTSDSIKLIPAIHLSIFTSLAQYGNRSLELGVEQSFAFKVSAMSPEKLSMPNRLGVNAIFASLILDFEEA